MNNPEAFAETYWSINSLRVYNESGKPATSAGLSAGAIAGIVVGVVVAIGLALCLFWRYRKRQRQRRGEVPVGRRGTIIMEGGERDDVGDGVDTPSGGAATPKPYSFLGSTSSANIPALDSQAPGAAGGAGARTFGFNLVPKNPKGNIQANGYKREGKTVLAPGKSARHYLAGETPLAGSKTGTPEEGNSRRGSAHSGPKALMGSGGGGEWANIASGGGRRGSAAPSVSGRGWAG